MSQPLHGGPSSCKSRVRPFGGDPASVQAGWGRKISAQPADSYAERFFQQLSPWRFGVRMRRTMTKSMPRPRTSTINRWLTWFLYSVKPV